MTRNQKIAAGCGGAGCLGLVVVAIAVGAYLLLRPAATRSTNRDFPITYNSNRNANTNSNTSAGESTNKNASSSSTSGAKSSSLSDDDKHKLFQAASMSGDPDLVRRTGIKIGLLNEDSTPQDGYAGFVRNHISWILQNSDFIQTINTTEKARAYVEAHIND